MEKFSNIEDLRNAEKACTRCPARELCTQVVPSIGPITAKIFFAGQCPGEDEDLFGEPFVGRSGQLLNKLLIKANIDRDNVFIANTTRCRPPGNADPSAESIRACRVWLWEELKLVKPRIVVPLGRIPSSLLLRQKTVSMRNVVGKAHAVDYMTAPVFPCYHPSYLLRQNNKMDDMVVVWLKKIKEIGYS